MSWIFVLLDLWGLGFSSAFEAAVGASVRGPGLVLPTCKLDHQASDVGIECPEYGTQITKLDLAGKN